MNLYCYSLLLFILEIVNVLGNNITHDLFKNKREIKLSIIDEPSCGELKSICNNLSENDDILILECLLSLKPDKLENLNEKCQNTVWSHIRALIKNERIKEILFPLCRTDLDKLNCNIDEKDGSYLKCIVNNKEAIQDNDCSNMVLRLEAVAFQDFRWISTFITHCEYDIKNLSCGRIDSHSLTQMKTLSCLQINIQKVKEECRKEVYKLSEMQSDSIKLDRQLDTNCAEDRARYCSQFFPGSGRVFTCLSQQDQNKLLPKCKQHLLRRKKLISQDYRVSKGLMRACKDEIKKQHCRRQTSNDKNIRLAQILLCLENVMKNGTKIDTDCEAEISDHRKMLMEDYRLSPEIVDDCKIEITHYCQGFEVGGKTIHCLMNHAIPSNNKPKLGDKCRRALESLVKQADVGEDWRVDPVLHQACYPVVKAACKDIKGGDARVMSCLMDNIAEDHMTEECEDALIQIQYFVARDFKLDPQLYKACREDASNFCHVNKNWEKEEEFKPVYSPDVLPCLYRYANKNSGKDDLQLNKSCLQQIRRVMRQRAISVDLQPEIEEVCLEDLAFYCHEKVKKGEEMLCLQTHFEDLKDACHDAVESFTEIESEHAELNPYIMKNCPKEMKTLCSNEIKSDEGDVMECLINHKNDPLVKANPACRASIEHVQLISIKDYRFTYKFKIACKNHAMRFCSTAKSKNEVIQCLSEHVLNSTIHGVKSIIPKECKQQLKAQLFQQRESINYDPALKKACSLDIKKFCSDVSPENAEVLECLQVQREKLTNKCSQEIFKVKKQEIFYNSIDFALNTMCADEIDQFCSHHDKETVLECLKINKEKNAFSKKCKTIVLHRMVEQNSNYQLNPSLQQHCNLDINKFCKSIVPTSKDINGPIIKCLKEQFKLSKLSNKCEKEMANILREQALYVNLNPVLRALCKNELETICKDNDDENGDIEECLKNALLNKKIVTPACTKEVSDMIVESQADIQVDPLLQQSCAMDLLHFCRDIPQGNSRHITCLKDILDRTPNDLSSTCKNMLKKRLEMYRNAAQVNPPEGFHDIYDQVVASPSKHYFFMMLLMVIGSIFFIGMFCGRATKKHMLLKNK